MENTNISETQSNCISTTVAPEEVSLKTIVDQFPPSQLFGGQALTSHDDLRTIVHETFLQFKELFADLVMEIIEAVDNEEDDYPEPEPEPEPVKPKKKPGRPPKKIVIIKDEVEEIDNQQETEDIKPKKKVRPTKTPKDVVVESEPEAPEKPVKVKKVQPIIKFNETTHKKNSVSKVSPVKKDLMTKVVKKPINIQF
jgi:hypothetical protein